ncbi:hypothetical protein CsSME_00013834 [Camellia sinensis var. sinensis]
MARGGGEWGYNGRGKWCSYKRTTLIVCSINIGVALYVLHSFFLYTVVKYTPDQIRKMEDSIRIRKASEPVKEIKKEFLSEQSPVKLPQHLKQKITDEIVGRLRGLRAGANVSEQREAVESWRKEKLKEYHCYLELQGDMLVGTLARALESGWSQLSNEIGLWIPVEINNEEHDDKPEGATDFDDEILAGRQLPPECHPELHTDYDGAAVRWGLTHRKESAYDCCQTRRKEMQYMGILPIRDRVLFPRHL